MRRLITPIGSENSSDQNSDRRCLTNGTCGASDQHIHRIDRLTVTHGSKRCYAGIHFNTVLCDAKLCHISSKCNQRKHLAPSAGFMKFCPSPPNRHFTTTIANTPPITASHHGRVAGRFNARSSPVTTALSHRSSAFYVQSY